MTTGLTATKRETGKHSNLTQLRNGGQIPAIIYGYNLEATAIAVPERELTRYLQQFGQNGVFELQLGGKKVNAMLTEVQRCALKNGYKHLDFLAIDMSEALETEVPVTFKGESVGVKDGGVLMQPNRELKIKVNPSEIPESIEVDISTLAIGDSLSVINIRDKIGFEILNEDDYTLVTVTTPISKADLETTAESVLAEDTDNEEKDLASRKTEPEDR